MFLNQSYDKDVKETVVVGAFVVVISLIIVACLVLFSVVRDSKHDTKQNNSKIEGIDGKDRRSRR